MPIFEEREKFIETVRAFLQWGDSSPSPSRERA
jgi:hypothetical protein